MHNRYMLICYLTWLLLVLFSGFGLNTWIWLGVLFASFVVCDFIAGFMKVRNKV